MLFKIPNFRNSLKIISTSQNSKLFLARILNDASKLLLQTEDGQNIETVILRKELAELHSVFHLRPDVLKSTFCSTATLGLNETSLLMKL